MPASVAEVVSINLALLTKELPNHSPNIRKDTKYPNATVATDFVLSVKANSTNEGGSPL